MATNLDQLIETILKNSKQFDEQFGEGRSAEALSMISMIFGGIALILDEEVDHIKAQPVVLGPKTLYQQGQLDALGSLGSSLWQSSKTLADLVVQLQESSAG